MTHFRTDLAGVLAAESGTGRPRDVVVLALDGIGYRVARDGWPSAHTVLRRSVWPTTTATSWLSQTTGVDVATHGVPGVVFRATAGAGLVNAFSYPGEDLVPPLTTVFHDATRLGYTPVAVLGDMETCPGRWRDAVLAGAHQLTGHRFYTPAPGPYQQRPPHELVALLRAAVRAGLAEPRRRPRLLWCYVEIDRHLHHHGYDAHTLAVLTGLERLACDLADDGAVVLAHADHGLVPTTPDHELAELLRASCVEQRCEMGGAGRTRWLYPPAGAVDRVADRLRARLPTSVRLHHADEVFATTGTSRARHRVGELVLTALGERFIVDPGYRYEHGSSLADEVDTPLASWGL
ncbi:alkaline phosphatase family protein [Micromonospora sp. FIMYZ51]|uniref:alkaline phosphatase family protein n=1 Tax=Micromonospora sp. FIMYZ51 TaxID=3051832 RepID=UPI00311FB0BB